MLMIPPSSQSGAPDAAPAEEATPSAQVHVSGPTTSPWLKMLRQCLIITGSVVLVLMLVALAFGGEQRWEALASVAFGGGLVIGFFTLSLWLAHYLSRFSAIQAVALYAMSYIVKFIGFAALLIIIGTPEWLQRTWFFVAAVAAVIVWQGVEIMVFAKQRQLAFGERDAE